MAIRHFRLWYSDYRIFKLPLSLPEVSTNPNTRNFFNSIGNPDDISGNGTEHLKLAIHPKFIRYFIEEKASDTIVFYGDYALQSMSGTADLADQLSNIFSKDAFLSISRISVLLTTLHSSIIRISNAVFWLFPYKKLFIVLNSVFWAFILPLRLLTAECVFAK